LRNSVVFKTNRAAGESTTSQIVGSMVMTRRSGIENSCPRVVGKYTDRAMTGAPRRLAGGIRVFGLSWRQNSVARSVAAWKLLVGSGFDDVLVGNGSHSATARTAASRALTAMTGSPAAPAATPLRRGHRGILERSRAVHAAGLRRLVLVPGPDGTDTLCTIEHLRFIDTTLDVVPEGEPLFDQLHCYSRDTDVYFAGADAVDHFDAFGRQEGRDPNAGSTPRATSW
jgi:hypothetical protein